VRTAVGARRKTPLYALAGFSGDQDSFIFYTARGEPRAAMPASVPFVAKMREGSLMLEPAASRDGAAGSDRVHFKIPVTCQNSRSKALFFEITLEAAAGSYAASFP
jgi:hypothetical protein